MIRLPWNRPKQTSGDAERAHLEAVVNLAQTEARGVEVRRVVRSLTELHQRNHIVENLNTIFGGGRA